MGETTRPFAKLILIFLVCVYGATRVFVDVICCADEVFIVTCSCLLHATPMELCMFYRLVLAGETLTY